MNNWVSLWTFLLAQTKLKHIGDDNNKRNGSEVTYFVADFFETRAMFRPASTRLDQQAETLHVSKNPLQNKSTINFDPWSHEQYISQRAELLVNCCLVGCSYQCDADIVSSDPVP